MIDIDSRTTALVLIDLQNGIVGTPAAPRSGTEAAQAGNGLAKRFRAARAAVVLVNVAFAADYADAPRQPVDQPARRPEGGLPPEWSRLVDGLAEPGDIRVTKRHWGAFTGTDLDLQLRRRGVKTIVLAGIATNFGVESTARHAWELGYEVIVVEDACASVSTEMHEMSVRGVLPRIARVTTSDQLRFSAQRS